MGEGIGDFVLELMRHAYGQAAAVSVPNSNGAGGILGRFPAGVDDALAYVKATSAVPPTEVVDWFFLIGAPGNGKSRAVQQLAAALGVALPPSTAGKPTSRAFPEAWPADTYKLAYSHELIFINDASIDRPAAAGGGGLSADLSDAFGAVGGGRHLILFANVNRGVLVDEMSRTAHAAGGGADVTTLVAFLAGVRDSEAASEEPYYAHKDFTAGPLKVRAHVLSLDVLSLLEPAPGGQTTLAIDANQARAAKYRTIGALHRQGRPSMRGRTAAGALLADLASEDRWAGCGTGAGACPASGVCPFQANARWLRDPDLAAYYLEVLRAAEVTSGWRLAYRELLAEFAAALLGPVEPEWSAGGTPCDWVRGHAATAGESLASAASLAFHRVYSALFGAPALDALDIQAAATPGSIAGLVVAALSHVGVGRAPRVRAAAEAIRPSRDTTAWAVGGSKDLRLAATERVEVMAVADTEAPSAWAEAHADLPAAMHSSVETAFDTAVRSHVQEAYAEADAPRAAEARLLMKLRLHLLLSQVGLATGQMHKRAEVVEYLSTQRALLDGEPAPDRVVTGLTNMIVGAGQVNLFSPRASTNAAAPGASQVSVQLASAVKPELAVEGDQLILQIHGAAPGSMPISFDLLREALVAAEPRAGFTDIPEIQLARIERARARLVSRQAGRTLNLLVTLADGRRFRIRPYMDDQHFELVEARP